MLWHSRKPGQNLFSINPSTSYKHQKPTAGYSALSIIYAAFESNWTVPVSIKFIVRTTRCCSIMMPRTEKAKSWKMGIYLTMLVNLQSHSSKPCTEFTLVNIMSTGLLRRNRNSLYKGSKCMYMMDFITHKISAKSWKAHMTTRPCSYQ